LGGYRDCPSITNTIILQYEKKQKTLIMEKEYLADFLNPKNDLVLYMLFLLLVIVSIMF
jgi:hypothetical protein